MGGVADLGYVVDLTYHFLYLLAVAPVIVILTIVILSFWLIWNSG